MIKPSPKFHQCKTDFMKVQLGVLAILASWFSQPVWALDSHCSKAESVIFNCRTGKKMVSVCASKPLTASSGYLQYRFGRKGAPEMVYPAEKIPPNADIQANTLMFAGGGGAYIRFKRGQQSYVVYTAIGKGWGEKAGIVVEKNLKLQAKLFCKGPVASELGPDFFDQAGLAKDDIGFDLP